MLGQSMTDFTSTSYDEVPYESHPFSQTHPDRLATVATLLGMRPKPVGNCRVLELGCAAGGNLIPMATTTPNSQYCGIDLSVRQIAEGQEIIRQLALRNIELKQFSILDVDDSFGKFDYIICHGVFSWVPKVVQDKILEICAKNLSPNGVAYVSYNTYPGWHMRAMIREMMCYHSEHFSDPRMRIGQARNLLDFMAKSVPQDNNLFGLLLKAEVEILRRCQDSYLFHEHLEPCNDPIYFYQFIKQATAKGLQYLGEADFSTMTPSNFSPEVENVLQMLSPDNIHLEQYMDFLRNRMFRQTLLCHQSIVRKPTLGADRLTGFDIASPARTLGNNQEIPGNERMEFQTPDGIGFAVQKPLLKSAFSYLSEIWPRSVSFKLLRDTARSRISPETRAEGEMIAADTQELGEFLLNCYAAASNRLVEFHVLPPAIATDISDRPMASPLARLQAQGRSTVTNLRHAIVCLDEFARRILPHLDGTNDRLSLIQILVGHVSNGDLVIEQDGQTIQEPDKAKTLLASALEEQLRRIASNALLVS